MTDLLGGVANRGKVTTALRAILVTSVASTTFANTGLANGTIYYFVVSAANAGGESPNSTEVSAQPVSLTPINFTATLSGSQLEFSWPATHRGWRLEAQTNLLATGLGANWFAVSGSAATNQVFLPINAANESVFFRLVFP